jgi:hypothetical protein
MITGAERPDCADHPAGRAGRAAREHDESHVGPSWIVPRTDCAGDYGIARRHRFRHHERHAVGVLALRAITPRTACRSGSKHAVELSPR